MRKYIIAVTLIIIGIILLIYIKVANQQTSYSDALFTKEVKAFDLNFSNFMEDVEKNIMDLQANFNSEDKIKDTTFIKDYLFKFMEEDPYLISTLIIKKSSKLGIKKDGKSIVLAIDTTDDLDVVKWQRYENNSIIGGWHESFESEINQTKWFNNLKKTPNQIQWLLKTIPSENGKDSILNELFYAGYYNKKEQGPNLILFEFSRTEMLKNFNINPAYEQFSFSIMSNGNKQIHLTDFKIKNDSVQQSKLKHFKKFDNIDTGTFSFKFKENSYWNSFKRFTKKSGIQYYLLTISDKDLKMGQEDGSWSYLNKFALFLITIGILILMIKKRFFYRPSKRITIPPVSKILEEDENRYLEFKSSARWDYRQEKTNPELEKVILKTLTAFGNTDGGILLIGVDDDKNIIGLEKDFKTLKKSTADYYEIHLRNILHNNMGVKYVSNNIRMQFETCNNQNIICIIKVLPANEPVFLKFKNKNGQVEEKFYVRSGNSSQEIDSIAEINDYINSRFKK